MTVNMAVLGLGAMGSATIARLADRGVRAVGFEQFTPGHDRGSSHGQSRIIRQAYFEHPSYVPLVQAAYRLWVELEERARARLLTVTGGLLLGPPDSAVITGSRLSARRWQLPHQELTAADVTARFPTMTPTEDTVGVFEERAGFVRPEAAIRAHLNVAREAGADLRFTDRVLSWETDGSGIRITTERGTLRAVHLVITAGAWSPRLIDLDARLSVERQVMHWFTPTGGIEPFTADHHPVYVWEGPDRDQIYGFPAQAGEPDVKVAFFRRKNPTDPDRLDRSIHPGEIDELTRALATRMPALSRHSRASACMYTVTPDHHFLLGPHPWHPQVTLAAGFSGHGFKFTPVIGEILADLATEHVTGYDITLFDPAREVLYPPGRAGTSRRETR